MKLTDCIITENGITCFYNNEILKKPSKFANIKNTIRNTFKNTLSINFNTNINNNYSNYLIGYILLSLGEIVIKDIIDNFDNIKTIDNSLLIFS